MRHIGIPRSRKPAGTEVFGTNDAGEPCFYIELQRIGVADQDSINPHLIRLAEEMDLPLVCDNDVHFSTGRTMRLTTRCVAYPWGRQGTIRLV